MKPIALALTPKQVAVILHALRASILTNEVERAYCRKLIAEIERSLKADP